MNDSSMKKSSQLPRAIVTLGIVSLLHDLAGDMVTPLVPAFIATLGKGPEALGLIEGIADGVASLLKLVSGYLADRVGRLKALTLAGYAVANLTRPLLAIAGAWWHVLLIRLGDRVGKGLRASPRDALIAEVTPEEMRGRAYGYHQMIEYIGSAAGPALGFAWLYFGMPLRQLFAWSTIPGVFAVLLLLFAVREVPRSKPVSHTELGLPPSKPYRRLLVASIVFTLGNSSDTFLLWRAQELGVATAFAPVLWIVLHVVRSATSIWGGALSDRKGRRFALVIGWCLYSAIYAGFGFASQRSHAWILMALYGVHYGLTEGALKASVVDLVDPQWRGRALGAYHAAVGLATLPASIFFGFVYQSYGARFAFSIGSALALAAVIVLPHDVTSRDHKMINA